MTSSSLVRCSGLVNCLEKTIDQIARALKPDGVSVHKVDLGGHGLDRYRPLDFLSWPDRVYALMYSRKGRPNRWRVDTYQELAERSGLTIKSSSPRVSSRASRLSPCGLRFPACSARSRPSSCRGSGSGSCSRERRRLTDAGAPQSDVRRGGATPSSLPPRSNGRALNPLIPARGEPSNEWHVDCDIGRST